VTTGVSATDPMVGKARHEVRHKPGDLPVSCPYNAFAGRWRTP
jgi:hypothetical protein